jgi:hypothetical protein
MDPVMQRVQQRCIPTGQQWVYSAQRVLWYADQRLRDNMAKKDFASEWQHKERCLALVERCFHIRNGPNQTDTSALWAIDRISNIYKQMRLVLGSPNAADYFQPAPPGASRTVKPGWVTKAYCVTPGEWKFHNPATHPIYVCTDSSKDMADEDLTDLLVHELAHYVSPNGDQEINHIKDGSTYGAAALQLNHERAMCAAACYAWLPWLARQPHSQWLAPV